MLHCRQPLVDTAAGELPLRPHMHAWCQFSCFSHHSGRSKASQASEIDVHPHEDVVTGARQQRLARADSGDSLRVHACVRHHSYFFMQSSIQLLWQPFVQSVASCNLQLQLFI
jgi:hypothetical protein